MTIERVDIEHCFNISSTPRIWERFKSTDGPVYDPHVFEPITYCCHSCEFEIQFGDKDFQKHSHSNFSNLNSRDADLIDDFVKNSKLDVDSFLDFYCPTCKKATRIYFTDGYGGKHGDYQVTIDFGLTIKKETQLQ